ncbi:MAG: complex I NDUFA9 subunit family protein [Rhodospirillaceae bacterium]|nr:complex I NDUFA9 subunit family protein [Rhodospirillaceae bacterium]
MADRWITVFGGSGFIGRYLVQRLAREGWLVRVAVRRPSAALFLKPLGKIGQIQPIGANITDPSSVAAAVAGSEAVVNLVGILAEGGRRRFQTLHVEGARTVAAAARDAGASVLVHMSALGADSASPSAYARTKAQGELAVRELVPSARIARPSVVFGPEDAFFNRFAAMAQFAPALPLIGGGATRLQPVYVGDVADALLRMVEDEGTQGRTYELGGPRIYTFRQLMELMLHELGRRRMLVSVPWGLADVVAGLTELMPGKPLTRDQVRLLRTDNVVSSGAPGLVELGVAPTALEVVLPTYMDRYRVQGYYTRLGRV